MRQGDYRPIRAINELILLPSLYTKMQIEDFMKSNKKLPELLNTTAPVPRLQILVPSAVKQPWPLRPAGLNQVSASFRRLY